MLSLTIEIANNAECSQYLAISNENQNIVMIFIFSNVINIVVVKENYL